jgi:hypothetical protein
MLRNGLLVALSALALLVSGCGSRPRADASHAVAAFLQAVHSDDRAAFEAAVDRPALRANLHEQLVSLGRDKAIDVDGGPSEFALDRMISPRAFRLVEAQSGRALPTAPTPAEVAPLVKARDRDHVCLGDPHDSRCLLTFARRKGVWRLVAMPATDLTITLDRGAARKN